jgi:class 3 adenylate cyclase/tetratricopeptide (TPR) repeat protein
VVSEPAAMANCPTCAGLLPAGGRFCPMCGMPVGRATRSQARKNVVILFTDLVGFTPMGERLDPEALDRVLDLYFRAAAEAVASHGGIIEKFIGDAVMAVFGLPSCHEDDAVRAVHAAVRLHGEIDRLNAGEFTEFSVHLTLRTGIGSGEVAVSTGLDGSPRVVGDAVNTSARLQQAAAPGEIVLGNTAAWMVRGSVDLESREPLRVKGKSQALRAWTVRSLSPGRARAGAALVGRDTELADLGRACQRVTQTRRGEIVVVSGEAGIGKTRLLTEATRAWRGGRVIAATCPAWGGAGPLDPVRQLMMNAFGDGWLDDLPSLLPDAAEAPRLAEALGRGLGLRPGATGPSETAWSLRCLLTEMAAGQPLVVTCDDFQHAEQALLDLLRDVVPGIEAPVLLIAAGRPEFLATWPDWLAATGATHVALGPLAHDQSRALIRELVTAARATADPGGHEQADPEAIASRVWQAAEGNPLFAEQLVAAVLEDPGVRVPPTVQALLESRLDRLSEPARVLLQRAAVVGRSFTVDDVATLAGYAPAVPLTPTIDALVHDSMLGPAAACDGRTVLEFVPGLLHDTAYGTAPKSDRSRWHEAFGRWLIGRPEATPEVVGHHLEAAYMFGTAVGGAAASLDLAADAAGYLLEAAALADNRGDLHGAATALRRAQGVLPPGDQRHRFASLLLSDLRMELGDPAGAREALDGADALLATDSSWPAVKRIQRAIVDLREHPSQLATVKETAAAPLPAAVAADPEARFRSYLLTAYVSVAEMRLRAASAALESALELAQDRAAAAGRDRYVDSILIGQAELALWGPEPVTEGIARCELLARRLQGDRARLVPVQGVHACLAAMTGDFRTARRLGYTARTSARELRLSLADIALGHMTGLVEAIAGAHGAAGAEYQRSADAWRAAGLAPYAAGLEVLIARRRFEQGRPEQAAALLDACAGEVIDVDVTGRAAIWSLRALLHSADGRHDAASEAAARAVGVAQAIDDPRGQGDAWLDRARVLLAAGDRRGAASAAATAVRRYRAKGATVLAERAQAMEEACR